MSGEETRRRQALWIAKAMARSDLAPLRIEDVEALAEVCVIRRVEAGTLLAAADSWVTEVLVVRDGELHLTARRRTGGRQPVTRVRPGGVVADIPLFCDQPIPFDVLAGTDATLIVLPTDQLLPLLQSSPTLSLRWTTSVAARLRQHQERMVSLLTEDLDNQVASVLLEECEHDPEQGWIVCLSHSTLAGMLGVRRQSVSRSLGRLRDAGLVSGGYRVIVIEDVEGLADLLGQEPPRPSVPVAS